MRMLPKITVKQYLGTSSVLLLICAGPALSETVFTETVTKFPGWAWVQAAEGNQAIYPGQNAVINGGGLVPGQTVTLMRGQTVLNAEGPLTVDAEGKFSFEITVDDEAVPGIQPIVLLTENPAAAEIVDLKISSELPVSGADLFDIEYRKVDGGQYLYQVAFSEAQNALFVTSSVGRPPIKESALLKIDPETLETITSVTPDGPAPVGEDGYETGLFAVYGVAVDDAHNHVWVSNTRQDAAAVYSTEDLSLVKQFEPGVVSHPRDVAVDPGRNRVYISASGADEIAVFDSETLEQLDPIEIQSKQWEGKFAPMALDIDPESGTLVTVSLETPEAAIIDLNSREVNVVELKGMKGAWGVAYDPQEKLLFAVSMSSDNLLIVNADSGEVLHDVRLDAGPLNVTFDPVSRLAFIASRSPGRITAVDTAGKIVANLEAGPLTNKLRADGKGNIYAVNQSLEKDDPQGDRVWRLRAKQ
ncbi:MAG: ATP-binding protein [Paracoccus sp. (in: a-proteobacteria)]|uniref:YncE family protein n=1 Tax=Paracoccus sp. TaxID=267 RepID=UPI0026DEF9DA|nr:ATP-binding protein [Paracoccus sp. (in: a-proteobacteria)]MDO5622812.1 ATP-binding protein [Paracoccus sp. (in: a-proteobacteria)]